MNTNEQIAESFSKSCHSALKEDEIKIMAGHAIEDRYLQWDNAQAIIKDYIKGALAEALAPLEREHEEEIRRWQDAILDDILKRCPGANIDGGGCDSGDPLDFTLSEIGQGINWWANKHFDLERERDELKQSAIDLTNGCGKRIQQLESSAAKVREEALREAIDRCSYNIVNVSHVLDNYHNAAVASCLDRIRALLTTPASNATAECASVPMTVRGMTVVKIAESA